MASGPSLIPYEGRTRSHQKFREQFKYVNALYYMIVTGQGALQEHLQATLSNTGAQNSERGVPDGRPYILGVVTNVISPTEFSHVGVHSIDVEAMINDFDPFLTAHNSQCVIDSHRMIVNFEIDLLEELIELALITLPDDDASRVKSRYINPKKLSRIWNELGVPVATNEDEQLKLRGLSELRNLIEHNNCLATDLYCRLFPEYELETDQQVPIGSREVGYSLAIIEHLAKSLDQRVIKQWPNMLIA